MRLLAAALLCFHPLIAFQAEKPALPPDIEELLGLARSAPPEIAAAAILRIVESRRVASPQRQVSLLEEAFSLAGQARSPVAYRQAPLKPPAPDTRAGYRLAASHLRLDRISLQTRAVTVMLQTDSQAAADLFRRMPAPSWDTALCGQVLIADAGAYYRAAQQVLEKGYTDRQIREGEDQRDRLNWIAAIRSPAAFRDALQALVPQDHDNAGMALIALIARLRELQTDWPTFAATHAELSFAAVDLAEKYARAGGDRMIVWDAFRAYTLRHLTGPRCKDSAADAQRILAAFNDKAASYGVQKIELREARASREIEEEIPAPAFYATDATQQIAKALRDLRFDPQGRVWTDEARRGMEWRRKLDEALRLVRSWSISSDDDELDFFHQKTMAMRSLYEMTPPGDERAAVLAELLAFLGSSGAQQSAPAEWMWHVVSIHQAAVVGVDTEGARARAAMKAAGGSMAVFSMFQERYLPIATLR